MDILELILRLFRLRQLEDPIEKRKEVRDIGCLVAFIAVGLIVSLIWFFQWAARTMATDGM